MRVCHLWHGDGVINFGIYACSPENSSFKAIFTNMEITECKWAAHNGQKPDKDLYFFKYQIRFELNNWTDKLRHRRLK